MASLLRELPGLRPASRRAQLLALGGYALSAIFLLRGAGLAGQLVGLEALVLVLLVGDAWGVRARSATLDAAFGHGWRQVAAVSFYALGALLLTEGLAFDFAAGEPACANCAGLGTYIIALTLFAADPAGLRRRLGISLWLLPGFALSTFVLLFVTTVPEPYAPERVQLATRLFGLTAAITLYLQAERRVPFLVAHRPARVLAALFVPVLAVRLLELVLPI